MADYLVHEEDGTSHFVLEEGGGFLALEDGVSLEVEVNDGVALTDAQSFRAAHLTVTDSVAVADAQSITGSGISTTPARLSQVPVEAVVRPTNPPARLSQLPVEVLVSPTGSARLSQLPVEVLQRYWKETVSVVIWD